MGHLFKKTLFYFCMTVAVSGCTAAGTSVTSLLGSIGLFKLQSYEFRFQNISELSNISVTAQCTNFSTGFEVDISNPAADIWQPIPQTFVTANDQCATSGFVVFTMDLSGQSPFSSMTLNDSLQVRFRDINALGYPVTETLTITYSSYNLASMKRIAGQGGSTALTSGSYSLKGRLVEISDSQVTSISTNYTMKGKVVFP